MGIALLLTGIGFLVLTLGGLERTGDCQANGAEACDRHELSGDSARKQRAAFGPPFRVQEKPAARISAGADFPRGRAANTERNRARSDHMSQKKRIRRLAAALAAAAGGSLTVTVR